ALKSIVFLLLLAVSLQSMARAEMLAEVEPFKTIVLLHFVREWPFVLYALIVLGVGLFIERAFCRYLCPLGAALAIPARLRQFEWLKRRRQCGHECTICARQCMVQAIHPTGQINPHECLYCLQCQTSYFDDTVCPPLILRRTKRAKRGTANTGVPAPDVSGKPVSTGVDDPAIY
ncbi:MAG: 4Fe-4S binding protein, partial [Alphaproteobacteria bacterium]|nr:4Fe-4S binding protein [Alphaproteobacteria bacterium]